MAKNTVLFLGDSTSMTIGMERQLYPFAAAAEPRWHEDTEMVNCSLFGFTAADAAAAYFRHRDPLPGLKGVVLYLGNCDASSTEIRKGPYTPFRQAADRLKAALGIRRRKTSLKNRLLHFEWNNRFDAALEAPEKPADLEYNLARIIRDCGSRRVPVVLIRPLANRHFPPGVGKGNFLFYRYLGLKERVAARLSIPDVRFKEALDAHEKGDHAGAMERYEKILLDMPAAMHSEYPLVVAHNFAAAAAESGDLDQAEHLLGLLLKERGARKEIVLYNLAQVAHLRGDAAKSDALMDESYENDSSLFRIRQPYLEAIDRLAARFPEVKAADMSRLIGESDFVDHCHPLPGGQRRLAEAVVAALAPAGGKSRAKIQNRMHNPELALGNDTEFFSYYKSYAPFTADEIRRSREDLRQRLGPRETPDGIRAALEPFPVEFRAAVEYHVKHPVFPSLSDVLRFGPETPSDIGRFPEFFLFRHLVPYLKAHERSEELRARFKPGGVLRTAEELSRALPEPVLPFVAAEPVFDAAYEAGRLPAILARVRRDLYEHLRRGPVVHERVKTTIFWYVREALRFGTHSRPSMRYERVLLEYLAEALAVAGILDLRLGGKRSDEIRRLISALEEAVSAHEDAARRFSLERDNDQLLIDYDTQLKNLADRLLSQTVISL